MMIDASIYSQIKQPEQVNVGDQIGKMMTLRGLADQNQANQMKLAAEKKSQYTKAAISEFERLNQLPPEQRQAEYPKSMIKLGQIGMPMDNLIKDQAGNPAYDEGFFQQQNMGLQSTPEFRALQKEKLDLQETMAKINKLNAESVTNPMDKELDRKYKIARINALNSVDEKAPTQSQFAAATFGTRAKQAEEALTKLYEGGFDPTSLKNIVSGKMPGILEGLKSEDVKLQDQAKENFINATLRRESGASISDGERASANKQYFPQVGDTPKVLQQKEINRRTVIASLNAEGNKANKMIQDSGNALPAAAVIGSDKKSGGLIPDAGAAETKKQIKKAISNDDAEALFWAKKNKNDPKAQKILMILGED